MMIAVKRIERLFEYVNLNKITFRKVHLFQSFNPVELLKRSELSNRQRLLLQTIIKN